MKNRELEPYVHPDRQHIFKVEDGNRAIITIKVMVVVT